MNDSEQPVGQTTVGYDKDAPPCTHCGSHHTHWNRYQDTSYDCHCEFCGRVFKTRETIIEEFENETKR